MSPPDAEQHFREAQRLSAAKQWGEALLVYQQAVAADENHWKARFGCALARQRLNDHAGAIRDLDIVLAAHPKFADALYSRAVSSDSMHRHDQALLDCDAVLLLRPEDIEARYLRGLSLKNLGRSTDAIDAFNVLLNDAPEHASARYCRATLHYAAGAFPAAISDLDAYLASFPRDYGALLLRGLAAKYDHRLAEALDYLTCAIDVDPQKASTYFRRALVFEDLGRPDDAAADMATGKSLS
jgi:tetratricopeptide (TPR) repeat protein